MRFEDISMGTLTTARRVLAGGAIAAVAVFGAAACEDNDDRDRSEPNVETPAPEMGEDGDGGGEMED
ncbi:hypothetical protein [Nocardiopsis halotolerans]|uniref:hypothetical protein n=1 Tax=Nocardiopsis halotolerans TaxID=124252 RepID=UPI00034CD39A|nr:hypothetical protein [Nocardiopsis halotolerans]